MQIVQHQQKYSEGPKPFAMVVDLSTSHAVNDERGSLSTTSPIIIRLEVVLQCKFKGALRVDAGLGIEETKRRRVRRRVRS